MQKKDVSEDWITRIGGSRPTTRRVSRAMRKAGLLAAEVLDMITDHVQPGVMTEDLDKLCHDYIVARDPRRR